jgi:hypothetical protein
METAAARIVALAEGRGGGRRSNQTAARLMPRLEVELIGNKGHRLWPAIMVCSLFVLLQQNDPWQAMSWANSLDHTSSGWQSRR